MSIADELNIEVRKIFRDGWDRRDGMEVPDPEDLGLGNEGVNLDAVVLYADLDGSTAMVDSKIPEFSGEVYKSYLRCCAKMIRQFDGAITAYDGDRVMAVFIGDAKNSNAARCALAINYAVTKIINPALTAQYPNDSFVVKQVVGIDASKLMATRTGVRGDNDLVWVGSAANHAAKLTTQSARPSWITDAVFNSLNKDAKYASDGSVMWDKHTWNNRVIYGSHWWKAP